MVSQIEIDEESSIRFPTPPLYDIIGKESRIILSYALPTAATAVILMLMSWDAPFIILGLSLYVFATICTYEDTDTLDRNMKTILIGYATVTGFYYVSMWTMYILFDKHQLARNEYKYEVNLWIHVFVLFLQEYVKFINRIAFFRIIIYSFVIFMFVIAKLVAKLTV